MYKRIISVILIFIIMICCLGNNKANNNKQEKIYKNIYIEDIDMSNMTKKECIDILKEAYPLEDINLKYEGKTWIIHPKDIDFRYKIEEATDIAMKYTKTSKRLENIKRKSKLILNERHHIHLDEEYDKEKLSAIIDCISNQIDREYVNATLAIEKDGTFKRLPSKEGKKKKKDELQKEIYELIQKYYGLKYTCENYIANFK